SSSQPGVPGHDESATGPWPRPDRRRPRAAPIRRAASRQFQMLRSPASALPAPAWPNPETSWRSGAIDLLAAGLTLGDRPVGAQLPPGRTFEWLYPPSYESRPTPLRSGRKVATVKSSTEVQRGAGLRRVKEDPAVQMGHGL